MERERRPVTLALQGGGSHGAFTWGVLDRLLESGLFSIEGVSGTSAGALNAALLVDGLAKDGPDAAREALGLFWHGVAQMGALSPFHRTALDRLVGRWNLDSSPGAVWADAVSHVFPPAPINQNGLEGMRRLILGLIDFDRLRAFDAIQLFVSATNVATGEARSFSRPEMSVDCLLASVCLPNLFPAVEIDGVAYWDGGYSANPGLMPLIERCATPDLLLVQINPRRRDGVPRNRKAIQSRVSEITFNAPLMAELGMLSALQRLLPHAGTSDAAPVGADRGAGPAPEGVLSRLRALRPHAIVANDEMLEFGELSKLNTDLDFLLHLREIGRETAGEWLDRNAAAVGDRATFALVPQAA